MADPKNIRCDDRRVSPRYDRIVRVSYNFEGQRIPAVSLDIGPTGVYLLTQRVPSEGSQVALEVRGVRLDSPRIQLVGEVVRVVRQQTTTTRRPPGTALRWVSAAFDGPVEILQQELKKLLGLDAVIATTNHGTARYRFPRAHAGLETDTIRGTLDVGIPLRWHAGANAGNGRLLAVNRESLSFEVLDTDMPPSQRLELLVSPPREAVSEGVRIVALVQDVVQGTMNPRVHCHIQQVDELPGSQGFTWLLETLPTVPEATS